MIWAAATANIIDRKYLVAAIYMGLGGVLTVFGVMHSPLAGDKMFFPSDLMNGDVFNSASVAAVRDFAIAYFVMAVILLVMDRVTDKQPIEEVQH